MALLQLLILFASTASVDAFFGSRQGVARKSVTFLSLSSVTEVNNVVLRPSREPGSFDSYKIGSPRVHRYSEDDGESSYIMWYHGRSIGFDDDKKLPPLSTGRIGRATSPDGLRWERTKEGSPSEDAPDVALGLNKESWWGFDTAHVGLGQVMLPMTTPSVRSEAGVYFMYYMGGNYEEMPIAEFLSSVPPSAVNTTVEGMKLRIGVAVSQDGMSWGRVEGDDPTGACVVPFDSTDPDTALMNDPKVQEKVEEECYCGWPDVVLNADTGKDANDRFLMFYSTMTKKDKKKCIAVAISPDGFRWFKRGVCIRPEELGFDANGCSRCNVVRKASFDPESFTWQNEKGWLMFYEGVSLDDKKHRVLAAESEDGENWKKLGVAIDIGKMDDDEWDCGGVGSPHVIRLDDGSLRMYYAGQDADGLTAIGVAKSDGSATTWVREQAQFFFA